MVKALRDQSQEAPRRSSCSMIVLPRFAVSSSQTRFSRKASRPISRRVALALSFANSRSTTICVAMPAWSVPRLPERVEAAHAVPADQNILQRVVEGMAHVQHARHVGRWDHDAEGVITAGVGPGLEGPGGFPCLVKAGFSVFCVECLVECHVSGPVWFERGSSRGWGGGEGSSDDALALCASRPARRPVCCQVVSGSRCPSRITSGS